MNYRGAIVEDIGRLLELLAPHCTDRETIDWLQAATADRSQWSRARGVFNRIRTKTLKAERSGKTEELSQYLFEEICAKTLHNLSGAGAPFDVDSPYWLVPNAVAFARVIGVPEKDVLACVTLQKR